MDFIITGIFWTTYALAIHWKSSQDHRKWYRVVLCIVCNIFFWPIAIFIAALYEWFPNE